VFRADVDAELAARPRENLRFVWVELEGWDPWDNARGERGLRIHYNLWQRKVLKVLRRETAAQPFDLVHHVSWGSLQQPPRVWRTGLPFVWGPLGGGQLWPPAFFEFLEKGRNFERARARMVRLACWNPAVCRAVRHAGLIVATNRETVALVRGLGARRVELMGDAGVREEWLRDPHREPRAGSLVLLAAGRCEPRKGIPMALRAIAAAKGVDARLLVAGEGPMRQAWQEQAAALGIARRVEFLGQVPWSTMPDLFARADAFVFPSLRDATGSVVLEAMSCGLPILTLDHQGVGAMVAPEAGIKVPVTTPAQAVADLANGIERLGRDVDERRRMGAAARACAAEQTWERRARRMAAWYEDVLRAHRGL
jgi:glycosyltransferase involved in cell wall biosynthesis